MVISTPGLRGPSGLYGITPEWDDTARLVAAVIQAVRGGMQVLQLRRKQASASVRLQQAEALRQCCRQLGIAFVVNDDWQLAQAVAADGVHLGRDDADADTVARLAASGLSVGVSCYNDLARVEQALAAGAASVALGAVYPSAVKPDAVRVELATIRQARRLCEAAAHGGLRSTVTAIGGIGPGNAAPVAAAGADALAVITSVFEAADIEAAARAVVAAMAPR